MSARRRRGVISADRAGFTIVELVITMVVAGVLMAAAFTILTSQIALFTVQGAKLETQVSLRTGASMLSWAF